MERWEWLERRLIDLLKRRPWLLHKLREPNGISWLVIEYWREYEGLEIRVKDFRFNPTSPETIARVARRIGVSRQKILKEIEKQKILGLYQASI